MLKICSRPLFFSNPARVEGVKKGMKITPLLAVASLFFLSALAVRAGTDMAPAQAAPSQAPAYPPPQVVYVPVAPGYYPGYYYPPPYYAGYYGPPPYYYGPRYYGGYYGPAFYGGYYGGRGGIGFYGPGIGFRFGFGGHHR